MNWVMAIRQGVPSNDAHSIARLLMNDKQRTSIFVHPFFLNACFF